MHRIPVFALFRLHRYFDRFKNEYHPYFFQLWNNHCLFVAVTQCNCTVSPFAVASTESNSTGKGFSDVIDARVRSVISGYETTYRSGQGISVVAVLPSFSQKLELKRQHASQINLSPQLVASQLNVTIFCALPEFLSSVQYSQWLMWSKVGSIALPYTKVDQYKNILLYSWSETDAEIPGIESDGSIPVVFPNRKDKAVIPDFTHRTIYKT